MKIILTKETYYRTASGKSWQGKPSETKTSEITMETYNNMASRESIKFWNGFCGGTCRAERQYTINGYVPTRVTRVSPDKAKKIVEHFRFEKGDM